MFDDPADFVPESQPSGSLVPPPRHPPTAIATATPQPPRPPVSAVPPEPLSLTRLLRRAIDRALDVADDVADTIVSATGIGPRRGA